MYAYNGAKCILAFLTGSQSLSQLDSNCQVFARQLPSKLIRESWLTSPLSNHCAPLFSLSLVKIWKHKKGCFGSAFHCLLYVWDIKCDQTIHPCEWLMSVKLVYHVSVNTEDKFGKNDASFWISIFLKCSFKKWIWQMWQLTSDIAKKNQLSAWLLKSRWNAIYPSVKGPG